MSKKPPQAPETPDGFEVVRDIGAGRFPLLDVFRGLERSPAFREYPGTDALRRKLARKTTTDISRRKGEWMYVAPHVLPPDAPKQWRPIVTPDDCIAVSGEHLRKSPAFVLYLDVLHELYHVVQRWNGRELWDEAYEYVDRPTEVEAYRFAVDEARRLGATDAFLRDYLKVVWTSPAEHRRLLKNVGVSAR
jgi:hypothetical protein